MNLPVAYAAGLIDGEGYIGVEAKKGKYYSAAVKVGMTAKALPVLMMLHQQYGGCLYMSRDASENWAEMHSWSIVGPQAAAVLRDVAATLVIKAEQAKLAIRLEDIKESLQRHPNGNVKWTDHAREHCEVIRRRIRELNATGPVRPEPLTPRGYRKIARLVAGRWVTDQTDLFSDLGLASFRATWPKSGMMLSGVLFEQVTLAPLTAGNESSSWPGMLPTPNAADAWVGNVAVSPEARERQHYRGGNRSRRKSTGSLAKDLLVNEDTMLLSTPQARDYKGVPSDGFNEACLARDVALLPTPETGQSPNGHGIRGGKKGNGHQSGASLENTVALLPTPNTMDSLPARSQEKIAATKLRSPAGMRNLRESVIHELECTGETTSPRSAGGSASPDGQLQLPLS